MLKAYIGKTSEPIINVIERGAVQKFALAIGDSNPLFTDPEYAKKTVYQGDIAPPTFPYTLNYGRIKDIPLPTKGLIHGEQTFEYKRPLKVGEEVKCYLKLEDFYEKKGSKGTLSFAVMSKIGEDLEGNTIFNSRTVTVITEAVWKEMTS